MQKALCANAILLEGRIKKIMGNDTKGTGTSPKVYVGRFCKEYMSVVGIILLSIVFTISTP